MQTPAGHAVLRLQRNQQSCLKAVHHAIYSTQAAQEYTSSVLRRGILSDLTKLENL